MCKVQRRRGLLTLPECPVVRKYVREEVFSEKRLSRGFQGR